VRAFGLRVAAVQVTVVALIIYFVCLPPFVAAARLLSHGRMRSGGRWQRTENPDSPRERVRKQW
jgi:hypothetical protein